MVGKALKNTVTMITTAKWFENEKRKDNERKNDLVFSFISSKEKPLLTNNELL